MRLRVIWQTKSPDEMIRFLAYQLRALVEIDRDQIRTDRPPPLYAAGVRYEAEVASPVSRQRRPGRPPEDWRDMRSVLEVGRGDCEDLTGWRTAELLEAGQEAIALPFYVRPGLVHCVVWTPAGVDDPSIVLGMPAMPGADFSPAISSALREVTS